MTQQRVADTVPGVSQPEVQGPDRKRKTFRSKHVSKVYGIGGSLGEIPEGPKKNVHG